MAAGAHVMYVLHTLTCCVLHQFLYFSLQEMVGPYLSEVYSINGMMLISRKR